MCVSFFNIVKMREFPTLRIMWSWTSRTFVRVVNCVTMACNNDDDDVAASVNSGVGATQIINKKFNWETNHFFHRKYK